MITVSLRSDPAKQRSCELMLPKICALITPLSRNLDSHDEHIWGIDVAPSHDASVTKANF
jgi:hypothetical protein